MNVAEKPKDLHTAYIGLGSNIEPEANVVRALSALRKEAIVLCVSSAWRAPALGTKGPDFLNAVVKVQTPLSANDLKSQLLRRMEERLGRRRSENKNAPRTIDLDILIFDDEIVDVNIWDYAHLALPLAECYPALKNPSTLQSIQETAKYLQNSNEIQRTNLFSQAIK